MRVNLLFGFLGSGKTTLLRRLMQERGRELRTAVIVNEFGDVGIDGDILRGNSVDMIELNSGCLCCSLKGSLLLALHELRTKRAMQRVIVEATGVAQPGDLVEMLRASSIGETLEFGPLVCVVDAAHFKALGAMLGDFYLAQIEIADVVILNKTDRAEAQVLEEAMRKVKALNPAAEIRFAERCDVDPGMALDGHARMLRARTASGGTDRGDKPAPVHRDAGGAHLHLHQHASVSAHPEVESFVLDGGANRKQGEVEAFFRSLPAAVWRAKGYVQIDGAPALLQYSMGQLELTPTQPRGNMNLIFIGRNMDRAGIGRRFMQAARPD